MNLKILFMILIYYAVISLVFMLGGSTFEGYSSDIQLNDTVLTSDDIDTGGLFNTGISFNRFLGLITVGIGLPSDTPAWFAVMFFMWQTVFLIFTVGFIISSIWNG